MGRARFIEINILLPKGYPLSGVEQMDEVRREIDEYVGEPSPQRQLTVMFTGDESQL